MKGEKGQVLPGALIALTVGALILIPFLNYTSTSIRSTSLLGEIMEEQYSAGAGVEDAMWRLIHDPDFAPSAYSDPVTYDITVNDIEVLIKVELDIDLGRLYVESNVTSTGVPNTFLITIIVKNVGPSTIFLEEIGSLLPRGFEYIPNSCQDYPDNIAVDQKWDILEPAELNWKGGRWELIWRSTSPDKFRRSVDSGQTETQRFRATSTGKSRYNEAWIDPNPSSYDISTSVHRYRIKAEAGDRIIQAVVVAEEEPKVLSWQLV